MYQINKTTMAWIPPEQIDPNAMEQIVKLSGMPFIHKHLAIMPDCHLGMGATVGSCIPTDEAIIPAAVGVDIGCGMVAVRTPLTRADLPDDLSGIREGIERRVPLSAGKYNKNLTATAEERVAVLEEKAGDKLKFYNQVAGNWRLQLGSAPATTLSRSPSMKRVRCGRSCTPARAASATSLRCCTSSGRRRS
jgi:tRNA-splicing ligase RtcB